MLPALAVTVLVLALAIALLATLLRQEQQEVNKLTAALLHTVGETRAATTVRPADSSKGSDADVLPYMRPRQIGMSPR